MINFWTNIRAIFRASDDVIEFSDGLKNYGRAWLERDDALWSMVAMQDNPILN
jgi:hypothetical protein